jgi:hypothetical protein
VKFLIKDFRISSTSDAIVNTRTDTRLTPLPHRRGEETLYDQAEGSHCLKIRNHIRSSPGLHQGTIRMMSVPQSAIFSVSGARTPRWLPVH